MPLVRSTKALLRLGARGARFSFVDSTSNRLVSYYIAHDRNECKPILLKYSRAQSSQKDESKENPGSAPSSSLSKIEPVNKGSNSKETTTTANTTQPSSSNDVSKSTEATRKDSVHPSETTFQKIGSTLSGYGTSLEELEKNLMKRLNENNTRRFRTFAIGGIIFVVTIVVFFGSRIRKAVTSQTADFAVETLGNESLKIQTQELARAVVQTILTDKEITSHAATFLKEASTAEETQLALLELVLHVLQHPQTLAEVKALAIKLIFQLAADKEVQLKLSSMFSDILQDPDFRTVLSQTIITLLQDPEILQAVSELLVKVSQQSEVTDATNSLLQNSALEVLQDKEILEESRKFAGDVMGDDRLQKEGGDAIWKSLHYALQPGIIRLTGIGLIALSIGAFRLFISPF